MIQPFCCVIDLFFFCVNLAFGGNAWRNGVIAVIAGVAWYRIDQHITHSGDVRTR